MFLKKISISFLLLLLLVSCGKNDDVKKAKVENNTGTKIDTKVETKTKTLNPNQKVSDYISFVGGDVSVLVDEFGDLTSTTNLKDLNKSIVDEDFKKTQKIVNDILGSISTDKSLTKQDKIRIQSLKYVKVMSVLQEGTYFYKEKEKSEEAIKIINNILLEYPYSVDDFLSNYYLGYSKEIIKDYTGALDNYNTGLKKISDADKDKMLKSILTNQIGHVYDLKGDKNTAYKYYIEAYKLYNKNYRSSLNIARYLTRSGKYKDAKMFYEYSLGTISNSLKSEIYFSLSSLELELNGLKPDINKSIDLAQEAIKFNKNYPMGYLALARGYYMLNNVKYDKDIISNLNTSIKLNPNGNEAYRYYSLYYLDKKDLTKALDYLDKSKGAIDKDMILMEDQRISFKYLNDLLKVYISISINNLDSIKELYNNEKLKYFIVTQLKRKNYGIYTNLSDDKTFETIINYYK